MSTLQSINPTELASDDLPLFFGDPNAKPHPIFPEYPWDLFLSAMGLIMETYDHLFPNPDDYQIAQFIECTTIVERPDIEKLFLRWFHLKAYWGPYPQTAWAALINQLRPPKMAHLFKIQAPEDPLPPSPEKSNHHDAPGREISKRPIPNPSPSLKRDPFLQDLKNLPTIALVKHYALVRQTTVFDYIAEQSHSISFARVHEFAQHHNNFKLSKKGKVVYSAGFQWIANKLDIHHCTVDRAFRWMALRKLVTSLWPADHRIGKNSGWYICTSMKQNLKLWSMAFPRT